jgi:hypothetical protein
MHSGMKRIFPAGNTESGGIFEGLRFANVTGSVLIFLGRKKMQADRASGLTQCAAQATTRQQENSALPTLLSVSARRLPFVHQKTLGKNLGNAEFQREISEC